MGLLKGRMAMLEGHRICEGCLISRLDDGTSDRRRRKLMVVSMEYTRSVTWSPSRMRTRDMAFRSTT